MTEQQKVFLKNQVVSLPNDNEELRCVFDVRSATTAGLPSDAILEGYVNWCENDGSVFSTTVKLPVFYSESWRTWYPLDTTKKDETPCLIRN